MQLDKITLLPLSIQSDFAISRKICCKKFFGEYFYSVTKFIVSEGLLHMRVDIELKKNKTSKKTNQWRLFNKSPTRILHIY